MDFGIGSDPKYCRNCGIVEVEYSETYCEGCKTRIFEELVDLIRKNCTREELLAIEEKFEGMYITDIVYAVEEEI